MSNLKTVVFRLGNEEYGLNINQVSYIERMNSITPLPQMPSYVRGIIELRGKVTPIVDLRRVLWERDIEAGDSTRIVAVDINGKTIGLVVDAATDVLDIPSECIQQPQLINDNASIPSLFGIAKLRERLLILIDINKLLHSKSVLNELESIKEAI